MGSLMAGWDSHAKSVKFERNKSLTKEEIDAYWRSKRQKEEEHLREISAAANLSSSPHQKTTFDDKKTYGRSNSGPLPRTNEHQFLDAADTETTNLDKLIHTHGWWVSSNWAHLNEPPVSAPERVYKYAPQFHVAKMATSDSNNPTGISA